MENDSQLKVAAISDRGLSDKRPLNEDSYLSLEDQGVFAVADGVGGAQAGDVASQMAMEILGEAFIHYGSTAPPEEIMKIAIERANQAIFQMASELPQLASMATTIAALHVGGNTATIAHVGDSRVYRVDGEGYLYRETMDHSVVEEEVRAGRMTPEQAANHPSRNVISRAVGAESTVEIDIKSLALEAGSIYLLCSDGITRHIGDEELGQLLTTGMSPDIISAHMKDLCYDRGAEDNLTAVIVQVPAGMGISTDVSTRMPAAVQDEVRTEFEEDTIASARSPFDSPADESIAVEDQDVIPIDVEPIDVPAVSETEDHFLMEETPEPEKEAAVDGDYAASRVIVPAQSAVPKQEFGIFGEADKAQVTHQSASSSVAGKILSSVAWLVLGAVVGFGGYYLWDRNNPVDQTVQPTPILVPKSRDQQLSTLEESRRLVDSDPLGYINAKVAPRDAIDHYLLGRAFMLNNQLWDAKNQFEIAEKKLGDLDEKNRPTLAVEIALAFSIVDNGPATELFKKELAENKTKVGTENSNTITSTASPLPDQPQ
jgi:protein phosphatase